MKTISVYDLQRISTLEHYSIFELVSPALESTISPYLYEYGIDTPKGVVYNVSQHRCLDKSVRVGFTISGEIRTDEDFLTSSWCTTEDRVIAKGLYDLSMSHVLASMDARIPAYGGVMSLEDEIEGELLLDIDEQERIEAELEAFGFALEEIRNKVPNPTKRKESSNKPPKYDKEELNERKKGRKEMSDFKRNQGE